MANSALNKALQNRGLSGAQEVMSEAPPSPVAAPSPSPAMGSSLSQALIPGKQVAFGAKRVDPFDKKTLNNQKEKGEVQDNARKGMGKATS